ncbi:MAG: hypothetical protein KAT05_14850, partial [Spirochaetes bacterium]|nr:hypothetical protein [Spirochaetota bacterium]
MIKQILLKGIFKKFIVTIFTVTLFLFPQVLVANETFENFDGQSLVSAWWGSDSSSPYVYSLFFENIERVYSGSCALKVEYDKAEDPDNSYSFFAAKGYFNLQNYDYLSFWVYNDGSPLEINLRIEDINGTAWEMSWEEGMDPLCTVTSTADWENMVLDLTRTFKDTSGLDWTQVKQ